MKAVCCESIIGALIPTHGNPSYLQFTIDLCPRTWGKTVPTVDRHHISNYSWSQKFCLRSCLSMNSASESKCAAVICSLWISTCAPERSCWSDDLSFCEKNGCIGLFKEEGDEHVLRTKLRQSWSSACICVEFCVKLGENNQDIVHEVGKHSFWKQGYMSNRTVWRWCAIFQNNNRRNTDQLHTGGPCSRQIPANLQAVQKEVACALMLTRQVAHNTRLSKESVHQILRRDLHLRKRVAKFVAHVSNAAQ